MQPQPPYQPNQGQPQQGQPFDPAGAGGYPAGGQPGYQPGYQAAQPGQQYPQQPYQQYGQPYQQGPGGYPPPQQPNRKPLIIGAIAALLVVAIAVTVILIVTNKSDDTAAPGAQTTTAPVPSPVVPTSGAVPTGPITSAPGPVTSAPGPVTSAPGPVGPGTGMGSKATVERAATLISQGQANVAAVYVCQAYQSTFVNENTLPQGVSATFTVGEATENGNTAQVPVSVVATGANGQTQNGSDTVTLQRNSAGAWLICDGQLGAGDQGVPNESNPPQIQAQPNTGGQGPTTAGGDTGGQTPGIDQATQVAQSWAAAISAGDTATAQQYLCSAYQGAAGGTAGSYTLSLVGVTPNSDGTATAQFQVEGSGQSGTASVAMLVEGGRWTICQAG